VTADVGSRSGGLDASIGFETLRDENSGAAMNDSLGFFQGFVNRFVSMADLIALSVVTSTTACSSSPQMQIQLRGGRIDALGPGASGVPAPETGLDETLRMFAKAGFVRREDAIGLTACGHTMGSVHHGGFPQVVPETAVTPNNTNGGIPFDSTPGVFDLDVVHEYLSNTGSRGGPLVTSSNTTVRSDLRLYASDRNATLWELSNSGGAGFAQRCAELLGRMIDTVPAGVVLTEPVLPMQWKLVNTTLVLDRGTGEMSIRGFIRNLNPPTTTTTQTIPYTYTTHDLQTNSSTFLATHVSSTPSLFGQTTYYTFSNPLPSGITGININNTTFSDINDDVFVVPGLSSFDQNKEEVRIVAAVRLDEVDVRAVAVLYVPVQQQGTLAPRVEERRVELVGSGGVGGYGLWEGTGSGLVTVEGVVVRVVVGDAGRGSEERFLGEVLA